LGYPCHVINDTGDIRNEKAINTDEVARISSVNMMFKNNNVPIGVILMNE
jgi:hypothetical protein